MTQVPTAEDFLRDKLVTFKMTTTNHIGGRPDWETVSAWMIEFAKLHREAILNSVVNNAFVIEVKANLYDSKYQKKVDKDSILNSYPIELIK